MVRTYSRGCDGKLMAQDIAGNHYTMWQRKLA